MEMEIIDKKQNPLLKRQEIRFKILHPKEPTPNRDSAREKIASLNNVKKEQVIIDNLETTFGMSETKGYAKIYASKEEAMKNEREHHLVRNKLKEGKKPQKKTPTLTTGPAPPAGPPAPKGDEDTGESKEAANETEEAEKKEGEEAAPASEEEDKKEE